MNSRKERAQTIGGVVIAVVSAANTALSIMGTSIYRVLFPDPAAKPPPSPNWEGLASFGLFILTVGFLLVRQQLEIRTLRDRRFVDAPHLMWQTPQLQVTAGALIFTVLCTNEGRDGANVKTLGARWSTGEPVTQFSVQPGTTIYAGVQHRIEFVVTTGVAFGSAHRTIQWSVCYADNAGNQYDTHGHAKCYADVSVHVGEVYTDDLELDRDSTPKDRNARYHQRISARAAR